MSLFTSRPKRYLFNSQKTPELLPNYKIAKICKKRHHYLCRGETTRLIPPVYSYRALNNLG